MKQHRVNLYELITGNESELHEVPHNTMRFDVQMSHVGYMIDDEPELKERLQTAIREAIIKAADEVLAWHTAAHRQYSGEYLAHESIHYDLS